MRTTETTPRTPTQQQPTHQPREHLSDPDLAAVLFAAWSGDPCTVVASPPGAGKTRLITHLAAQLHQRAGLRVVIAAQTRAQALDVANRVAALDTPTFYLDGSQASAPPAGLSARVNHVAGAPRLRRVDGVVVATTARWLWTATDRHGADVLLVDEAYQMTYADLAACGSLAPQMVLVGDPGQIDPVVTGDTSRWRSSPTGPQVPAPTGLLATHGERIARHNLTRTWRCGPETTALIQPAFYPDLPFTSARPPTHLADPAGTHLPEVSTIELNATSEHDPQIAATAAAQVRELLTHTLTTTEGTRLLTPADIAVVTPHVPQASLIAAHLADLDDLLVGTANAVQGSERHAAVIVHPLTGQAEATDFNTDPGRTCVALSRHRAHARIITDPQTLDVIETARRDRRTTALDVQHRLLSALLDLPRR